MEEAEELLATDSMGAELRAALDEHGNGFLREQLNLLAALPQVQLTQNPVFDRATPKGSTAQKRGAICKIVCCGGQLDQKCNDLVGEQACPTVTDAVRLLRLKVLKKHGSDECTEKSRRWKDGNESNDAGVSTATPSNALLALMAGQSMLQRAQSALRAAEKTASQCRAAHVEATKELEKVR
ncbi:hypothetical protein AB1Y20_020010 [Prymnesium parvum]|uniref:Uncharacterized protein n=1 Tax=Prymnesium parvum TaxID=97485 RepID=A0AB34JTX3_PRYPA|mmetsp:Transcript_12549/g.31297  ORF Transcript_12549/g.31297 Transcript_12549/m.31297 type:complete len:182 (-) Transcript_12549:193-738(-)|eukprot:CAMPEP_0182830698 /NCGR_PEP_ID=MMETSP0006_2-20121128/18717_1 /TAXON_ID=97485 /ORGANISM="Prymnesium parvum, Strain Texoma1" /LENGTH=181 /DNA_ID=CAMNT_0024958289 /DNA_START=67 /DNA_END=612 /DNA_ORIENTATION=-